MIICCGEALIDMLPRALPNGDEVYLPVPGGAIFNTAIALGRLGEDVGFLAGVSNDLFGAQLIEALGASKVNEKYCVRVPNPTTLAFVKLTNGVAEYSFMDESSATRSLEISMLPELGDNISALHFGAISLISEPCGTAYEALMKREAGSCVISFDPNIRVGFVKDEDAYRGRIERMLKLSDIVKVSDEDLDWITNDSGRETAIKNILAGGASIVLLTKGSEGVTAFTDRYQIDVPSLKVEVVDTIGAGDTFNAGFLSGLNSIACLEKTALQSISQGRLANAVALGNKVASVTVSRAGADPPWKSELS